MNSRVHGSEKALAELACAKITGVKKPRLLIGGLGMGFTLAAALHAVGADAEVVVAELVPEIVAWNRTLIGAPAGHPLADPRSRVHVGDVAELIRQSAGGFDAILMDVDNGPEALVRAENDCDPPRLRSRRGRAAARGLVGEPGSRLQQAVAAGRVRRRRARRAPASRRQRAAAHNLDRDLGFPEGALSTHGLLASAAVLALSVGGVSPAAGQTRADCERQYTPQRAQEGKDVVWAPTEDAMLGRMLEMAKVTAADKVYDLGAGDGKIVIAAAKRFGATGVGIEYDADLVKHARCLAAAEGVADRVTFIEGDIFETDFSDATVVTLYLLPELNLRLRPTLLAMKPGTRVVSYSFTMGDWEPDDHIDSFGDGSAYSWVVPADVAGRWVFRPERGGESFEARLDQTFQNFAGAVRGAAVTGKLSGEQIDFAFVQGGQEIRFTGTAGADRIVGTVARGPDVTRSRAGYRRAAL